MPLVRDATKKAGTQKVFPLPPCRGAPPLHPLSKKQGMLLNRSRGELGGKPFAQHCSCPAFLDAQLVLQCGGCGDISLCGKNSCLNRTAQKAALNRHSAVVTAQESFAHRTRRCALSLWRRKKIRKQNLRHIFRRCVSRKYDNAPYARANRLPLKNGCCHFS